MMNLIIAFFIVSSFKSNQIIFLVSVELLSGCSENETKKRATFSLSPSLLTLILITFLLCNPLLIILTPYSPEHRGFSESRGFPCLHTSLLFSCLLRSWHSRTFHPSPPQSLYIRQPTFRPYFRPSFGPSFFSSPSLPLFAFANSLATCHSLLSAFRFLRKAAATHPLTT